MERDENIKEINMEIDGSFSKILNLLMRLPLNVCL